MVRKETARFLHCTLTLSPFGNEALNPSMSNRTSYSPGREEYPSTCYLEFSVTSTLLLHHFSRVRLCATPETAAHQASRPWDSPGKNPGVGCHFLLQCMKGKSEREVTQSCPTLHDPRVCSLPGSSVHGIFQARVLEWGAIAFSIS